MTRTFLDAGVLIAAARGIGIIPVRAHTILDDAERTFVTSDYIRMEVLPKRCIIGRARKCSYMNGSLRAQSK